jgi:hypothetical protein
MTKNFECDQSICRTTFSLTLVFCCFLVWENRQFHKRCGRILVWHVCFDSLTQGKVSLSLSLYLHIWVHMTSQCCWVYMLRQIILSITSSTIPMNSLSLSLFLSFSTMHIHLHCFTVWLMTLSLSLSLFHRHPQPKWPQSHSIPCHRIRWQHWQINLFHSLSSHYIHLSPELLQLLCCR